MWWLYLRRSPLSTLGEPPVFAVLRPESTLSAPPEQSETQRALSKHEHGSSWFNAPIGRYVRFLNFIASYLQSLNLFLIPCVCFYVRYENSVSFYCGKILR